MDSRVQFLGGKRVALKLKPYLEVFNLSKLLIPGVQIQIDTYFNSPDVWTIGYDGARTLRLTQADMNVRLILAQVKVASSVHRDIVNYLKSGKVASYPTVRGEIRTYAHPGDIRHFECNNPFYSQVPNRLVVLLLDQAAFIGDPFNFEKFNLSSIKQLISGEEYPYETLNSSTMGTAKIREVTIDSCKDLGLSAEKKGTLF